MDRFSVSRLVKVGLMAVLALLCGCGSTDDGGHLGFTSATTTAPTPVLPLTASRLGFITQPARAGEAFRSFQVGVFDDDGNLVTDGTVQITVTSPSVTLQGETTQSTSQGVVTFDTVFTERAGTLTLVVSAPGLQSATSSQFIVGPADLDIFQLSFQPQDVKVGANFNFSLLVTDRFGNPIPGLEVTVELLEAVTDLPVPTTGTTTATTDTQGVATFTAFSAAAQRTAYLRVNAANTQLDSGNFNIFEPRVPGVNWRVTDSGSGVNGFALGNGRYLAVGEAGGVYLSDNGQDWQVSAADFSGELRGVAFGNGLFVAVGDGGGVLTSVDGTLWVPRDSTVTNQLNDIVFANGIFLAVGNGGTVITSPNGIDWTEQNSTENYDFLCTAFGDGVFVLPSDGFFYLYSADGVTWQRASKSSALNGAEVYDVTYGPSGFVGVSFNEQIFHSANGTSWTRVNGQGANPDLYAVAFKDGQYLAVAGRFAPSGGLGFTSPDGVTWTRQSLTGTSNMGALFSDGTSFLGGTSTTIYSSGDGLTWTRQIPPALVLNDILYTGQEFLAVGNDGVFTSPDGESWTAVPEPASGPFPTLLGVGQGPGLFVAVGSGGALYTSPDGQTWTSRTTATSNSLYGVAYANNVYVVVGRSGHTLTSPDGITWNSLVDVPGASTFEEVTFGAGLFVAVDRFRQIYSSPDGVTWTQRLSQSVGTQLNDVEFLDGQFVVAGAGGTLVTSSNGTSWNVSSFGTTEDMYGLVFQDGLYVAVGGNGTVLTSTDAVTWTPQTPIPTNSQLNAVAATTGLFVAVGSLATIVSP